MPSISPIRLILLFLIFSGHMVQSQELIEPLELSELIFSKTKFRKLKKYTTGEYQDNKNHPNGTDLSPSTDIKFQLLSKRQLRSVVAMTLIDPTGKRVTDTYLHYKLEDGIWKLSAFRGLAMTGMIEQMVERYGGLDKQQIDSLLGIEKSLFKSKEQFDFELANSKLTIASDEKLTEHFIINQEKFQELVKQVNLNRREYNPMRRTPLGGNQKQLAQKLLIRTITDGALNCSGCMELTIGGMIDNTVGYLYITDQELVPKMHPNRYIMVRKIAPYWFLFKTT